MKEFFGFGGYTREPEGYMSWQHLLFVGILLTIMTALAIVLGMKNRKYDETKKNKVLIVAAILIDSIELFKIILFCFRSGNPMSWLYDLPLFLCSIQLITIPLAAFSKGRVREAALDFVFIFGLLGAILGTIAAGNNYAAYPVLSADNVISGITHCISGFSSLYIAISGLSSMKKKNALISFAILIGFSIPAAISIYWIMNNILTVVQEYIANKIVKRQEDAAALKRAEEEARKKRNKQKAAELEARERAEKNSIAED